MPTNVETYSENFGCQINFKFNVPSLLVKMGIKDIERVDKKIEKEKEREKEMKISLLLNKRVSVCLSVCDEIAPTKNPPPPLP